MEKVLNKEIVLLLVQAKIAGVDKTPEEAVAYLEAEAEGKKDSKPATDGKKK